MITLLFSNSAFINNTNVVYDNYHLLYNNEQQSSQIMQRVHTLNFVSS